MQSEHKVGLNPPQTYRSRSIIVHWVGVDPFTA